LLLKPDILICYEHKKACGHDNAGGADIPEGDWSASVPPNAAILLRPQGAGSASVPLALSDNINNSL